MKIIVDMKGSKIYEYSKLQKKRKNRGKTVRRIKNGYL